MRETELRLALVCYGGVSLAVYMHGITKEVWRLAAASRARHDGATPAAGSQGVYHALLDALEEHAGVRLRVLPDIVAGASAGGINGIFLAQAIATGQSLDPLTDLWLASADVEALIGPDAAPGSRFSKMWARPIAWMAAGRSADKLHELDDATQAEVKAKLSHLVRSRWFEPPFSGAGFTGLLLDALEAMASSPRGPRLLPAGQPLDLFVTVTDFGGHPERLTLNSPPEVVETEHRVVVAFTDGGAAVETLAAIPELAFAARATSSFPGAFPPFTVGELDAVLKQRRRAWPGRRAFLDRVLPRQAAAGAADKAVLIDGSVLANAPFRPAIEALRRRPARRAVDRRFVYVDPSPGTKIHLSASDAQPGWFQTILGALSDLPRQQPIRDNLEAIAARSAHTERLRGIVTAIRPTVEAEVEALLGPELDSKRPTPDRLKGWRNRAHEAAVANAGYAHAAYLHLKIAGILDTLGELVAATSSRRSAATVAAALDEALVDGLEGEACIPFLRAFDFGYRVRRLRLLARGLAALEGEAEGDEAALAPVRDAIYAALASYLDRRRPDAHPAIRSLARTGRPDWRGIADALETSLDLKRLDDDTDAALAVALAQLAMPQRRPLLLTYLGFPWFDVATLPLLGGEGLDEFDAIKVDRISPDDAAAIRSGGAEATLKGIQFNNFGAFFSRAYRENDYLWGRLHGAERLIDITVSTAPKRLPPGRIAALKRRAFLAILDEEAPRLTAVPALIASLRTEIG
ncbi:patatin-like protein [Sphingomonas sp.]|uniref:patatin-like protein n=1 Tax=Sphingomonas sp. TaxID=28214 RepID=UPI003CC63AF6